MVAAHRREGCDLCGLEIDGQPVIRTFDEGDGQASEKHFCCQGCARVYEVARENDMLDYVLAGPGRKPPRMTDLVLSPGQADYFSLDGMWCAGCAVAAEKVLRHQPGVRAVDISFAAERGRIEYDPEQADPTVLLKTLDNLGYRGRVLSDPSRREASRQQQRTLLQLIAAASFGMQVMILYLARLYPLYASGQYGAPETRKLQYLVWLLATPALLIGGNSFLRGAWRALRARTATMDTLVALGTVSAYSYSVYVSLTGSGEAYFDSVVMITTFVMFGRYLETVGGSQARKDIRRLVQLQPDHARRRVGDDWQEVEASTLTPEDTILIRPGERVPADGVIVEGEGALSEALLSGESLPVNAGPGDPVYAGTVSIDAALVCQVTRPVGETRLAHITRLVEQTLAAKPPVQRLADRASAYFAFGILAAAIVTAVGWWLAGRSAEQAVLTAVAVLVVACPCALGLATPLALAVTLGRTAQRGILVRNLAALETVARVRRIVFDKTGTLTRGEMAVTEAVLDLNASIEPGELVCRAAAVEQYSEHPIARAIVAHCREPVPAAAEFQMLRGLGASAQVGSGSKQRVMVGSERFVGIDGDVVLISEAQARAGRGETVVWVGWGDKPAGFIALRDEPNPTAAEALRRLAAEGIVPVMLSGDNPRTTAAIAAELRLEQFEGACTPQDKAARIEAWQAAGEQVAMVGDGVNDAPALAQANLSITSAGGTDVAGETSDVILTEHDLTLVPWFLGLARRTRRVILENLVWAFAYNVVAVPLAALGIISPIIAAAAMTCSSLLVVGNSLRLQR